MADEDQKSTYCCVPPTPGLRVLTFPDRSQVGVMGLDEILSAVYAEGRQVSAETAEEIVERLAVKNYIIPSARQEYRDLLMGEYEKYVRGRTGGSTGGSAPPRDGRTRQSRKRWLSKLLKFFDR